MSDRFNTTTLRGKTGTDPIDPMPSFRGPSALDLLTEFIYQYGSEIDRRAKELHDGLVVGKFDTRHAADCGDGDKLTEMRRLDRFRPELHRLIQAFVAEAVKPLQDVLRNIAMRTAGDPPIEVGGTFYFMVRALRENAVSVQGLRDEAEAAIRYVNERTERRWFYRGGAPLSPSAPNLTPTTTPAERLPGDGDPLP